MHSGVLAGLTPARVGSDAHGASVEDLRRWAALICDGQPHPVELFNFEDEARVEQVARTLVETCPSMEPRWRACGPEHPITGCY